MKSSRLQKHLLNIFSVLFFAFIILNVVSVYAGPSRTTYQAKIVKPDGYPLEAGTVNFKFTILDPSATCILFAETYSSVNMTNTGGLISFSLGSGVKSYPVSSTTFEQVFSNITPNMGCDTGGGAPAVYTPLANDPRKIIMQFNDGGGWQTLPAMTINAVPYAMYANDSMKFNGKDVSDFVQVSSVPTCTASEALRYTGTAFQCVAAGGSGAITSGSVVTAFGYTPADAASLTTVTSNLNSVSSTIASVSSTVYSVSSAVTNLQSSVAASFAAITSSQWSTSGTSIFYGSGKVGIGTSNPSYDLDIAPNTASGSASLLALGYGSGFRGNIMIGSARGDKNNPLPPNNNDILGVVGFLGHNGSAITGSRAGMRGLAAETWTTGANGTALYFYTTPISGTASLERLRITASGSVGIGTATPVAALDVSGAIRIGVDNSTCSATLAGTLRYNSGVVEYCNGTTWSAFGVSGAGILAINGLTSGSQTFTFGSAGAAPNVSSTGTVHTFNFPLASVGTTTAGVISNSDYTTFMNKITSSAASIAQVLGYAPANQAAMATSFTAVTNSVNSNSASLTSLTNSVVTSFATITSSQWANVTSGIAYSSGFIGAGTSAPIAALHAYSTSASVIVLERSNNQNSQILYKNTVTQIFAGMNPNGDFGVGTNPNLLSNPAFIATASQTVGIGGVTVPDSALDVNGAIRAGSANATSGADLLYARYGSTSETTGVIGTKYSTGGIFLGYGVKAGDVTNNYLSSYDNTSIGRAVVHVASDIEFLTAPTQTTALNVPVSMTQKMVITSAGNIGIGTSSPTGRLEVQSAVSNTTLYQVNSSMTHSTVTSGSFNIVGVHTWVRPGASTGAVNSATAYGIANRIVRNTAPGADDNGTQSSLFGEHIAFGHSNVGGASPTTLSMTGLYLDPQLGAGTVNNLTTLRLATPSLTGANVINRWGFAQDDTAANNYFQGNLGLGFTTPNARLQIGAGSATRGPLRMTAGTLLSSAQSGTIEYDGTTFYVTDDTNTRRAISTGSSSGSVDNVSNINSNSNITMTPTGSVVVSSTTASTNTSTGALVVKGGLGVAGTLNATTINATTVSTTGTVTAPYFLANTGVLGSNPGDYVDMQRWTGNNGNISYLDVRHIRTSSGTSWFSAGTRIQQKIDSTWMGYLQFNGSGNDYGISFGTGNSTVSPNNISERMRITDTGQIGIGTSSPTKLVHVQVDQNSDTALLIKNSSSGTAAMTALDLEGDANGVQLLTYSANAVGNWGGNTVSRTNTAALRSYTTLPVSAMLVGTGSPSPLHFITGDAPRLTVTSAGKVGIGTISPNDALQVYGVATATSGTGNLSMIPDYLGSAYIQSYQGVGVFRPLKIDGLGVGFDAKGGQFSFTAGNVGIGSAASATYKVQITGSSSSGSAGATNINAFTGNGVNIQGSISNASADAITYQGGGSGGGAAIAFRRGGSYDTYIDFYTNTAGTPGAMTRQLVLNNYGYLGMGVSNPTVPLDFNLNNGYLRSQLSDGGLELGSGNDDSTYIDFHGSGNLNSDFVGRIEYQDSSGFNFNVGGTAAPALFIASATKYIGMNGVTAPTSNLHIDTGLSTTNYTGIKLQNAFKTWTIGNNIPNSYNNIFGIFDGTTPRMWINSNGNVGFGANNPATNLAVNSTNAGGYTIIANQNSAAGGQEWRWYSSSTGAPLGADSMCFGTGVCLFNLYATGNATLAGTLTQNSDVRFKRDIASIPDALSAVSKLEGVTYYWKDSTRDPRKQIGLIAQEVEKVFPEAVATSASGYKSVAYQNLIAPVINAIKEIREWMFKTDDRLLALENARKQDKAEIDELKKQNETLKLYLCEKDPQAPVCK